MMVDLAKHRIQGPQDSFYIPDFVTQAEEEYLVRKITESPRHKWKYLANRRLQLLGGEITSKNTLFPQEMPPFIKAYPNIIERLQSTGAFRSSPHGLPNHVILNEYLPGQGIMPHEDGPSYHPVVATISLGSHAVFHYYNYKSEDALATSESSNQSSEAGRVVNPVPILSVLLEPRSVIITTSSLYTSHLHGIQELHEDIIVPTSAEDGQIPLVAGLDVPIANWHMLTGENERRIVQDGGTLRRGTRYSLTCRDVEKVAGGTTFLRP
ncbi:hypothetical protein PILCRDRAFT_820910 [Piloderma croceum F 1598]|uniref:Fe2OG dioxygenase domain-containing protein n=1 Tax=Piloderma croceum (strain F 1598) TaxID=765440 RepID=A0A0C3BX55_PILCF|nr:hypothetical protein PILCRDRAFT_820910 [Piloderma croceum F 1598]